VKVTQKDVEHVAKLARLGLTEEEKKRFTEQLSNILEYAEAINKLDTKDIAPTSHAIPMKNVMRDDKCVPFTETKAILDNAPSGSDNMFIVPKILD
jgi:aspartyl-tRNA(Asn)/glutamyl-tRNA(Gln) amidotransferase subunit C